MSAAMTTVEFLSYLRNQKVDVWTEDGKLRYRSNGWPLARHIEVEFCHPHGFRVSHLDGERLQ